MILVLEAMITISQKARLMKQQPSILEIDLAKRIFHLVGWLFHSS
jgi:hypothetical protein